MSSKKQETETTQKPADGFQKDMDYLDSMIAAQKQKWKARLKEEGKNEDSESFDDSPEGNVMINIYVPRRKA